MPGGGAEGPKIRHSLAYWREGACPAHHASLKSGPDRPLGSGRSSLPANPGSQA